MKNYKNKKHIIDAHAHFGYWPTLKEASKALLISSKVHHFDFTLVSFDGTEFRDGPEFFLFTPQLKGSKKMLSFIKKHQDFYGMLVWVRPHLEKNIDEIDSFINENREYIYGIKYHPYTSRLRINNKKVEPYIELARKYNLPILVHTASDTFSALKYLLKVCEKYKDINFVAAHCVLMSDHYEIIDALKKHPNLYCDTAWVDMDFVYELYKNHLIDRVMFGTDNPIDGIDTLNNPIYEGYYHNKIKLPKNLYDKVMYKNALRVYKIDNKFLK